MTDKPARQPSARQPLADMTDGDLADEYRGQHFAKTRAVERMTAIEAELERRGSTVATGRVSRLEKKPNAAGLVDLKRLRAEEPELCARFAMGALWSVRTLKDHER